MLRSCLVGVLGGLVLTTGCSETQFNFPIEEEAPVEEEPNTVTPKSDPIPEGVPIGGVNGTICAEPEKGLEGAIVFVEHEFGVAQTATDEEGYFELEALPAGRHVLVVRHAIYNIQIIVDVPQNEVATVMSDECVDDCGIPVPCLGLAEAVDRGVVSIRAIEDGEVEIRNTGEDYDVCLEEWVIVRSPGSQDAILGQEPRVVLRPGQVQRIGYAVDVFGDVGDEAWWCVEERQMIASGVRYVYNGSLAPDLLFNWVRDRTDANFNGREDHAEITPQNRIQSQENIWTAEEQHPIFLVGRARSLHRFEDPLDTEVVNVEVINLGQVAGSTQVYEIIPEGFSVSSVSPPAELTSEPNGDTLMKWDVTLAGAISIEDAQAQYDRAYLNYTLGLEEEHCEGRCVGKGVYATWTDSYRRPQESFSEPLILEVCPEKDEDDGEG